VILLGIWWIQCDLSLRCVLLHLPLYGANDRELLVLARGVIGLWLCPQVPQPLVQLKCLLNLRMLLPDINCPSPGGGGQGQARVILLQLVVLLL
jgi:hypothetical protein